MKFSESLNTTPTIIGLIFLAAFGTMVGIGLHSAPKYRFVKDKISQIQKCNDETEKNILTKELSDYIEDNKMWLSDDYRVSDNGEIQHTTDKRLGSGGTLNPKKWHSIDYCEPHED